VTRGRAHRLPLVHTAHGVHELAEVCTGG